MFWIRQFRVFLLVLVSGSFKRSNFFRLKCLTLAIWYHTMPNVSSPKKHSYCMQKLYGSTSHAYVFVDYLEKSKHVYDVAKGPSLSIFLCSKIIEVILEGLE